MSINVIFDMNGVLVNDERIHQESWRRFCAKRGFHITEDEFKHNVFGRTEVETLRYLFKRDIPVQELEGYLDERVSTAIDIFMPRFAPADGVSDLLATLQRQSVPLAIATSSRRRYTNFILDGLNLKQYFNVVVTAEDITQGKPDPEIYLQAAQKLSAHPSNCIVIEDSLSGIRSAQAAGMRVVAVATTHQAEELSAADVVVPSLAKFDSSAILSLVSSPS